MSAWVGHYLPTGRPGRSDNLRKAIMTSNENKNTSSSVKGGEGVRVIEERNGGSRSVLLYKLLALVLMGCFVAYLAVMWMQNASEKNNADSQPSASAEDDSNAKNESNLASSSSNENAIETGQLAARPVQQTVSHDPNDLSYYIAPGQTPKMEEVIERLHEAGIHEGIGAFNPPGTSPPMIGIAVPDDYVLPEGYVRHFQATDDGQRIEPILMYSPDFEFFDSNGLPIAIPDNRVVPNNRAPPGLVIRPIKIPDPLEPGGP